MWKLSYYKFHADIFVSLNIFNKNTGRFIFYFSFIVSAISKSYINELSFSNAWPLWYAINNV